MPKSNSKVDLLNGPVALARALANVQNASFRGQFLPQEDLMRQWMSSQGIRLKDIDNAGT